MGCWKKKALVIIMATLLVVIGMITPALAEDPRSHISGAGMAFDFVVLRPLGIAATAAGCGFFIATLPFTLWSGERIKQSGHGFVVEPAYYTFVRPLGELGSTSNEE